MRRLEIVLAVICLVLVLAMSYSYTKPAKVEEPKTDSLVKVVELADKYAKAYKEKVDYERISENLTGELEEQKLKLSNQNKLLIKLLQELMVLIPKEKEKEMQEVFKKFGVGVSK